MKSGFDFRADAILTEGPVDPGIIPATVRRFASHGSAGADVVFMGHVRADVTEAGTVRGIEYTAHESMARTAFATVVGEAAAGAEVIDIEVRHSLGYVPAGGISLLIAVATAHRDEAYRVSRAILEGIKRDVPIYGREVIDEQTSRWKVNR